MRPLLTGLPALLALGACSSARPAAAATDSTALRSSPGPVWSFLEQKYDADHDGRIARGEYPRSDQGFRRLDADGDGVVSPADFDEQWDGKPRVEEFVYGEGGPEAGDPAPGFALPTTDGATLELASFQGKRPVALVFGSYT